MEIDLKFLFIVNDPPYETERTYNALRLAGTLCPQEGVEVKAFLLGDAVGAAKVATSGPTGHHNLERMVGSDPPAPGNCRRVWDVH